MAAVRSQLVVADRSVHYAPTFGAVVVDGGARFGVWAPEARTVDVVFDGEEMCAYGLRRCADGIFRTYLPNVPAGSRYRYRLDGGDRLPDPASRFQPDGVHASSMLVDPSAFRWSDEQWSGVPLRDIVLYELHVGTFTREGTFRGVESKLDALVDLGVTAIELMPVAESAGRWNWGYDNVDLFAPSHNYGTPDDLRQLVNAAHGHGISVILDVVYNHLGPDGAYMYRFSPRFRTERHQTPWGAGVNLDGPDSHVVRAFLIENALHWIHEYHVDGLRVDATHAMQDDSARPFLADLTTAVHACSGNRHVLLFAEDERNECALVAPVQRGGLGFDAVWADDFHHQVRRAVAGDHEGYYESYSGTARDIAETVRQGWFFTGQFCDHLKRPRGTVPDGVPLERFVFCLQNHDQVGNRALGDRLHHGVDLSVYRAVSALLLLAPETPLLFMGQEWATTSPFLFFTDHEQALGRSVTAGRREEFAAFSAFADPASRAGIPDPQDPRTFDVCRLDWHEREHPPHASVLRLYRALLQLRRELARCPGVVDVHAPDDGVLAIVRSMPGGASTMVIARIKDGAGTVEIDNLGPPSNRDRRFRVLLTTENAEFADAGRPPTLALGDGVRIQFSGPAAIVIRSEPKP